MSEIWFIYAPGDEPWAGLRLATFTAEDDDIFFIHNEPSDRLGPRIWSDVGPREGWVRVKQIELPSATDINHAMVITDRERRRGK